jgi:hypothetical protein
MTMRGNMRRTIVTVGVAIVMLSTGIIMQPQLAIAKNIEV